MHGLSESSSASLVDLLHQHAEEQGGERAYTFLTADDSAPRHLSWSELEAAAGTVAAALTERGLAGERAILLYPPGLDFIAAFLGCLWAGVIAVPAYAPTSRRTLPRFVSIARDAGPRVALTTEEMLPRLETLSARAPELAALPRLATDNLPLGEGPQSTATRAEQPAFLQYTSGSTSAPKGVVVRHGNLMHQAEMMRRAFELSRDAVIVGWLPLFHDMGLIGNVLQPLYLGARCVLMAPMAFLRQPRRWLEAISHYRATVSGGPNFAYELCADRIAEADRAALDLSRWRVAFNGAEPVRPATLERFADAFAPSGFRREAFYPCYGLAEGTLFVTGGTVDQVPRLGVFQAEALAAHRVARAWGGTATRTLASNGRPWMGQGVVIADPETRRRCAPSDVGEIWVAGDSVAQGYWKRPEASEETFRARLADDPLAGPFLRTGDLGFLSTGELFVAGRLKDLIIIRGRNHHPHDLELTVEQAHPALRLAGSAAFSVEGDDGERLVVVSEAARSVAKEAEAVATAVRQAIAEEHELQVHEVVLLRAGTLPKTSSGKVQRHACRAGYLDGTLTVLARSALADQPSAAADGAASSSSALYRAVAEVVRGTAGGLDPNVSLTAQGLDSLAAVELEQRLASRFGLEVTAAGLLAGLSLAEIEQRHTEGPAEPRSQLMATDDPTGDRATALEHPLSLGQEGLWFLHRLAPASGAYHIATAARVRPTPDRAALHRALAAVAQRHPALRTTFHETPDGPVQRVATKPVFEIGETLVPAAALDEHLEREAYRPFDPAAGPLLRLVLFRHTASEATLLLTVHHLIADFWSLALLVRELGALYAEGCGGPAADLAPVELSYADYVHWQRHAIAGPVGESLWRYWRDQLRDVPPTLELATDRPRPPVQTYRGAVASAALGSAPLKRVHELAGARSTTRFTLLLTAFQGLLSRLTGQEDLVVGAPTTGRDRAELAGLMGYFVNPVALRADVSGRPSFETLLDRVGSTVHSAFEHRGYPFALLAERLQPERDPSRSPLFQVMFTLQQAPPGADPDLGAFALGRSGAQLQTGGLTLESLAFDERAAPFDLVLRVAEVGGDLALSLLYNADLFEQTTARRLLGHYQSLLSGAVLEPARRLAELPLLSRGERAQLLNEWTDTATAGTAALQRPIHELVALRAARDSDAPAVVAGDQWLSYGALDRRSSQLANTLLRRGVEPESRVGVLVERSPEMLVTILGILKAGCAYVPLDPAYPTERLAYLIADAEIMLLLTHRGLGAGLAAQSLVPRSAVLDLDRRAAELSASSSEAPDLPARLGQLAYVIYTSGSTGRPKGVAVEHRGLLNLVAWHLETYQVTSADRATQIASLAFDAVVWEIWPYLVAGARLDLADESVRSSADRLGDWFEAHRISLSFLPTPLAEAFLSTYWASDSGSPRWRALLTGGDRLRQRPKAEARLVNHYGPTENSVVATWGPVAASGSGLPTIGRPIANVRVHLLDPELEPVPLGVGGELYLGGASLARGYLGRPRRTAEVFLPDPFAAGHGARLYRTGDLARWQPSGEIDFLGRADHQIKLRGHRIELGEIEATLATHPQVSSAVALLRQDLPGGVGLVAHVVAASPDAVSPETLPSADQPGLDQLSTDQLTRFLRGKLPEFMVPRRITTLDALPLTPNGKVDRAALSRLALPATAEASHPAATTPVEELVAGVWSEALGGVEVGSDDDFFALGGHSLLATRVIARVRELFAIEISLGELLQTPTVAGFAERIEAARASDPTEAERPIEPLPRDRPLPLSFAQERLWFLDQLQPDSPAYNMPAALHMAGPLRPRVLQRSLREVLRRHEALRTTFPSSAGKPVQVLHSLGDWTLPVIDLRPAPEAGEDTAVQRLANEEARRLFDLARGPLLRASLLRRGPEEHVLLLTLHHIVADGWSMDLLVREVTTLYAAYLEGEPSPLPELPVQYADYAAWQRSWLDGAELERQLAYWREQLADAPTALELPTDRPRPPMQSFRGALRSRVLAPSLGAELRTLSRQRGATLFMTLVGSLSTLLWRLTGQRDVLLGSPVANRDRAEIEDLIGFFVNMLVLRSDLSDETSEPGPAHPASFDTLLERVRPMALAAYAHQDLPFERLVDELRIERALDRSPLFQVALALQHVSVEDRLHLPDLQLSLLGSDTRAARFDLTLWVTEGPAGLELDAEFSADLFDGLTVERWLGHFEQLLQALVTAPEQPLAAHTLLAAAERHQLLTEWNDTRRAHRWQVGLHEAIETQVAATPEAVALVFEGRVLSYRELNRHANRLAHHLRDLGVGPDTPVGIAMERSLDLVVGLLAILKAGGAYMPLDPSYPSDRLQAMLEDARPPVLLTQSHLLDRLPDTASRGLTVLRSDRDGSRWVNAPEHDPPRPATPENTAYILFTSGSTGRPKGVMVSHGAVSNRLLWMQATYGLGPGDRVLQKTPFSFDVSVWEFFWPLWTGACLVIARPEGHRDGLYLVRTIEAERITTLHFVPSMLRAFLATPGVAACRSLERVICSGEALAFELQESFYRQLGARLENLYGPTEAAIDVTWWPCARTASEAVVPIGRPVDNTHLEVRDRHLRPAPLGVAGELLIGGVQLARGYLGRPALSAERFIPDPGGSGERLYRTGDLARYRTDGSIEFLGRLDHQVKLRGFRIELGEIEAVLQAHPGVDDVAVLSRELASGDSNLVAYIVPDSATALPVHRLARLESEGRLAGHERAELPNGLPVVHKNRGETAFLYQELFEDQAYKRHGIDLVPGACVFDVGANIGLFALYAAQQWPGARVYAFEPLPPLFEVLDLNLELHGIPGGRFAYGLGSERGEVRFEYFPHASILSGRHVDGSDERETVKRFLLGRDEGLSEREIEELLAARLEHETYTCQVKPLSEVIREEGIERIDLLKVDVEKSELEVLRGIAASDWPKIRQVVVEVHDQHGRMEAIRELLARHGFEVVVEQDRSLAGTELFNLYARRTAASTRAGEIAPAAPPRWVNGDRLRADVQRHALSKLPDYMAPQQLVWLDALPLSANGKLDRRALERIATPTLAEDTPATVAAPRTPTEELLCGLWMQLLDREQVRIFDSFFDLGGHSLLATQAISQVRSLLAVEMSVRQLFQTPSIAGFAEQIEAAKVAGRGVDLPPIEPIARDRTLPLPLSFAQERLWFLDQLEPDSAAYHLATNLRFSGHIELAVLERALTEVVRRHEVLRTRFVRHDGEPQQHIEPSQPWALPLVDLSSLPPPSRAAEARRLAIAEARRPFDLGAGHLLRTVAVRLGDDEHRLVVLLHHIVADGWSTGVLVREVTTLYRALSHRQLSPLEPLPVQYADFAIWQRRWLTAEALAPQIAYWKGQLTGAPQTLALPTDRPRTLAGTAQGSEQAWALNASLSEDLGELARAHGSTLFMTLAAALQTLLQRYSGQRDLTLGTPVANRRHSELEGLVGLFVNTLVVRGRLAGDPPFSQLLGRTRATLLEAYAHQDLPFEQLVEILQPERLLDQTPLFQVMLTFQSTPDEPLELPGLEIESEELPTGATKLDLSLNLEATPAGLRGSWIWASQLFDRTTILRLIGSFERLLRGIVARPATRLSQLPLLSAAERAQLVGEWAPNPIDLDVGLSLIQRLEASAARWPEAVAVTAITADGSETRLMYRELDQRAEALAHELRARGVGPEGLVAVAVGRGLELPITLFAILKAGGAFLPLDLTDPVERTAAILADARPNLLVSDGPLAEAAAQAWPELPRIELGPDDSDLASSDLASSDPASSAPVSSKPSSRPAGAGPNLAYVIYTSGSSGRPKGVMVSHGSLLNYLLWVERDLLSPEVVHLPLVSRVAFDASLKQLFIPLLRGGTVQIPDQAILERPSALLALVDRPGAALNCVPSLWETLLQVLEAGDAELARGGPSQLLLGGEALSPDLVERTRAWLPAASLANLYGPTEATANASAATVDGPASVTLGRPVIGTTLYALGHRLELQPAGVVGELGIGGAGVARGYLGRPRRTAESFVPDPWCTDRNADLGSTGGGGRLYLTGDLVRRRADGSLHYVGRRDDQVKVRGFRVELGEIEAALTALPEVAEAAVVLDRQAAGGERLVAYVVSSTSQRSSTGQQRDGLGEALGERLPRYMVPATFVALDELPRLPGGKIDRRRLAALPEVKSKPPEARDARPPSSPVEEILAGIWCDLFGLDRVGPEDDFFALGGHSLLATQVASRLRRLFGIELPLRRLFQASTLAALTAVVEEARSRSTEAEAPAFAPVDRTGDLPLSFAQERLWLLHRLAPESPAYNLPNFVTLDGALDIPALRFGLEQLMERHEVLRSVFPEVAGEPVARLLPPTPLALPVVDLAALPAEARRSEAARLGAWAARRPFDLARGPLVRASLIRLAPRQHQLLLTLHHILSDGWSLPILIREVGELYRAGRDRQTPALSPLPIQYVDFAAGQRQWLRGEVLERQLDFWRLQLQAPPSTLELPSDRARPAVRSNHGATTPVLLPTPLRDRLEELSQKQGVTLFMTLLAVFQTLLSRLSGQQDLAIGTPIAGRQRLETEALIGLFINTLVLRSNLPPKARFTELLERAREVALEAYAHQDLPFERLVEALEPQRNRSQTPLFQVMLILQNAPTAALQLPGLSVRRLTADLGSSKFDLTLAIEPTDEGLAGEIEYNRDLFDATTVARWALQLETLSRGVANDPTQRFHDLPLLARAERHQLLAEWNDPASSGVVECLHEIVDAQTMRTPETVAVVSGEHHLSYLELGRRAEGLAGALAERGVGPEIVVGLCTERSVDLLVGLLGILRAGGAYLPLDPTYPAQRLAFMLADAAAPVLVTRAALLEHLPADRPPALRLDDLGPSPRAQATRHRPGLQNLAYVIYTSGSTGRPKGVQISHRALMNFLRSMAQRPGLSRSDVLVAVTSLSFDIAALELFLPLSMGARVVVANEEEAADGQRLRRLLANAEATVLQATPATWQMLEETSWQPSAGFRALCGGEALPLQLAARLRTQSTQAWNLYGPTETTIWSTAWEIQNRDRVAIGRPIAETEVYLLDGAIDPVPIGAVGELMIGSTGLARGYLDRPGRTAAAFLPHPFSEVPGRRFYRTGDLARYRADGSLECLGRIDHQVKVRGFRIELGEIEARLSKAPGIRQAAVLALDLETPGDRWTDRRLVACVVPRAESVPGSRALRDFLLQRLPDHMAPSVFVPFDELPLTPNGKLDRGALGRAALSRLEANRLAQGTAGDRPVVAPRNPVEELLVGLWADVLGRQRVGIDQSFFDLGGHSLLAVKLLTRVRDHFDVELSLKTVFESPTVGELATRIEGRLATQRQDVAALEPQTWKDGAPLSFAQEQMWFFAQLQDEVQLYNLPAAFRLRGELSLPALRVALAEIARRHQVLRTRIVLREGQPWQEVLPARIEKPVADLSGLGSVTRRAEVERLVRQQARIAFDLEQGPMLRLLVLQLAPQDHVLAATLHHIAADGWSFRLFAHELEGLYAASLEGGGAPSLPALPVQYFDYAAWQRRWLDSAAASRELAYWRQALGGAPPLLELPTDRPRPAVMSFRGAHQPIHLPSDLTRRLSELGRRQGTTPFITLLTAFLGLLHRWSGSRDLVVGSPMAHRPRRETEDLIGLFLNMVALRTDLAGNPSFTALLHRVRTAALAAYAHQNLPFERLVEELAPARSPSYTPVFQVTFTFQGNPAQPLQLAGLSTEPLLSTTHTARFDLTLSMWDDPAGWQGDLEYNIALFDPSTLSHFANHFTSLLAAAAADPEAALTELPLLSPAEHHQLLAEWPDTQRDLPTTAIHQLFEQRVERTPTATALLFGHQRLTYRELDHEAEHMAHRLRARGVGREVVVGVHLQRGPELVIALLGVLKAGGAYLPLDPEYPSDRLAFMVRDAGVPVLITAEAPRLELGERSVEQLAVRWSSQDGAASERSLTDPPAARATLDNLAYVIYTSGSTGRPKGVMICHRNVVNFFVGMDERLGDPADKTWLAVTSMSFDISVLEIFWTLTRGATVVIQGESPRGAATPAANLEAATPEASPTATRPAGQPATTEATDSQWMDFSLFYFASAQSAAADDKYRLLLEGAKAADRLGFAGVWTPERHFHDFGGLYPNPATTGAAVAAITERVQIRAGSVVLPLHHPVRVAEEWSVVDNISGGRAAISFASGWQPNDFVFAPQRYADRKDFMLREIETVRRLWRGESVALPGVDGNTSRVELFPKPVQAELPFWLTAGGNPETFRAAGAMGARLLTHLLGQSLDELAQKIAIYREAWRDAGHGPGDGHVSLMLHTFVGDDVDEIRELVRQPFYGYLRSSSGLMANLMRSRGHSGSLEDFSEEAIETVLKGSFERYFETSSLMGSPETCLRMAESLAGIGVDEVACLIDFGVEVDAVLGSLEQLAEVQEATRRPRRSSALSVPEELTRHRVSHLQCTPSMAKLLVRDPAAVTGLASLEQLLLGGEALPPELVTELRGKTTAEIHNLYGPTETTIWSAAWQLPDSAPAISIGREITNTRITVCDRQLRLTAARTPGQLYIAGEGLARGYLGRPGLTAERFPPDPFSAVPGERLYATGDMARRAPHGELEFLGRVDHQLKLHGYRIEPAEIEGVLRQHPVVREAVVAPHGEGEDLRLVAYVVPAKKGRAAPIDPEHKQRLLAGHQSFTLPNGMTVAHYNHRQAQGLFDEVFAERPYLRHGITYADGDTIFDVGANAGFFSLFASQVCQPAKIYAFEPIPDNCELYRINTALHRVEAEVLQCGVADQPGTANFVFYRNAAGLSGRASGREADIRELKTFARHNLAVELGSQQPDLSEQEVEGALDEYLRGEERTCRLVTLSQIIAERGVERIDLLKIDVERSEVKVLEGLAEDDWPKIRQVILEVHSRELLAATRALLEAHGFRIAVDELMSLDGASESESLRVYMVYATRPEAEAETGRQPVSPEEDTLALSWVDLRTFIGERLPDYMVPAIFTPLDSLPLTPNGKVDRSALPAPHGVLRRQEADYVPPKSALERQLASAWQDVLKVDRIGRHENFFEAGGTSLLLVQLHRELQQTTERELSLVDLFRHPTIESMATFLQTGPQERANVAESRDRARKQAEALTGSNARERQRQFLQRRRRGRRARPRHPHG